jgi:hypothetical protein
MLEGKKMMEANNDLIFPKYLQLELFRERILVSRATKNY